MQGQISTAKFTKIDVFIEMITSQHIFPIFCLDGGLRSLFIIVYLDTLRNFVSNVQIVIICVIRSHYAV